MIWYFDFYRLLYYTSVEGIPNEVVSLICDTQHWSCYNYLQVAVYAFFDRQTSINWAFSYVSLLLCWQWPDKGNGITLHYAQVCIVASTLKSWHNVQSEWNLYSYQCLFCKTGKTLKCNVESSLCFPLK